jgi:hypothetical protein
MDPERAARLAAKRNQRAREKYSLFAGQLEVNTDEQVI